MWGRLIMWARVLKRDVLALYLGLWDERVPWYAKVLAVVVAGYALSPVDLIPDFIPVLGWIDDAILVPLGIWLVVRLIPPPVMEDLRREAAARFKQHKPKVLIAAAIIVGIWVGIIGVATEFVVSLF